MLAEELAKLSPEELEELKKELIQEPLESAEELRAWVYLFFDILFPMGVVYPDSTHAPVEAMWEIYNMMKTGESANCPQATLLSSRDSYKTLCAAALEVLCMVHLELPVAHMAAIKPQSAKAVQYVNSFFRKIRPYLEHQGWQKKSDSKTYIDWITPSGETVWLNIVTATIAGANCIDPDSVVKTTIGDKKAKDIKQYDVLVNFNPMTQEYEEIEVLGAARISSPSRELVFSDGSNLILSHKHKVFTQRGWLNAGSIKVGDKAVSNDSPHISMVKPSTTDLNWSLESMVYGTLLGDASLQKLSSGNVRYQVFHCEDQLEYLQEIQKTFIKNNISAKIISDKKGYKLYTEVDEYFSWVYDNCYISGRRAVSDAWLEKIDRQALAFLIMDDGTTHRKKIGKYKESPFDLAVMGFTVEEQGKIVKKIKKLGYEAFVHKFGDYSQIRIPISSSRDLSFDVQQYFVDCLRYKLLWSDDIRFNIDTGTVSDTVTSNGFCWEDRVFANRKGGRDFRKNIKKHLNKEIVEINDIGNQDLVGITLDLQKHFNLRNFFANGTLVHNSEHVPMLFIDEVDVIQDPRALKEAKMIPSVFKDYFPMTVYLSTRKFAGGLMEKTLEETISAGGKVFKWNIIDVTERISLEEAEADKPKVVRYVTRELPLGNISPEEWESLPTELKVKYEKIEAYAGIAEHPMLSVIRNYLVDRPQEDTGDLYKPLVAVHNNFKQTPIDMAEAQLLCNKPSSSGLVYPRFEKEENVISVNEAIKRLMGDDVNSDNFYLLKDYIKNLGVPIIGGADWGFTDMTAMVIIALMPNGEAWHLETFAMPELEIDDIVKYGSELQNEWNVDRWYVDQAYPAYIKTLKRKAGWKIPSFKKDVQDGIAALQSKIVDSENKRRYFVIDTKNNKEVVSAFGTYRWALDGKGEPIEGKPNHGTDGTADIMDAIRYPAQNLFMKDSKPIVSHSGGKDRVVQNPTIEERKSIADKHNEDMMKQKIKGLATKDGIIRVRKKGKIFLG